MSETTNSDAAPEVKLPESSELLVSSSPHLHDGQSVQKIMLMVILCLMPACVSSIYFFGLNAIRVLMFCMVFCVLVEMVWCWATAQKQTWKDGSAALTGILLGMNLNAGIPWWVCLIGAVLAIILGKQLFGGIGYNPFNPALVARVGLLIGFPKMMTTWEIPMLPDRMTSLHGGAPLDSITQATPLGELKTSLEAMHQNVPGAADIVAKLTSKQAYLEYFLGKVGGCLGETSALALLIGGIVLILLKLIRWQVPVAYIGTVAIFTGIVWKLSPQTTPDPLFHILTGGLMLGAFFMATDMVTSPMTGRGAFIFGVGCGLVTCIIRIWGNYPEGVSFSILFMNALVPLIDRFSTYKPFGFQPPKPEGGAA